MDDPHVRHRSGGIATTRPVMGIFFATSRLTHLMPHEFFGIAFWIGFTTTLVQQRVGSTTPAPGRSRVRAPPHVRTQTDRGDFLDSQSSTVPGLGNNPEDSLRARESVEGNKIDR